MKMNTPTNIAISAHDTIEDNDIVNYSQLAKTILRGKWFILLACLIGALVSFLYAYGQEPTYRADALLRVESQKATIPGIEALGGASPLVYTELIIIKSRKNLGLAVDSLGLEIKAWPKRVPLLGNVYKNLISPDALGKLPKISEKFDNFTQKYAWGNESIVLKSLSVPDEYQNQLLTLIVKHDNTFDIVLDETKEVFLTGKVGQTSTSKDNQFSIYVTELNGLPNSEFNILKQSKLAVVDELNTRVVATDGGDKKTGIINLMLEGQSKKSIVAILSNITETYLSQNKSRSSEEASKALVFLQKQIAPLKKNSEKAEVKLRNYRTRNQTANMSMETQAVLDITSAIETDIQNLSIRKDELGQKYTANHPALVSIASQERKLKLRKKRNLSKISKLPHTQQSLLTLERDFKVANRVYRDMLNKVQEFKIAKASGSIGNVYIVDSAAAHQKAVKPNKALLFAIGPILGALLAMLLVLLRQGFSKVLIDTPDSLEKITRIPVLSSVPFSKKVKQTIGYKADYRRQKNLLALKHKPDVAIEGLRSFRSSLHYALSEARNNVVMITGTTANTGTSFIVSNLSALTAAGQRRLLLIDGDLRNGYLHSLLKQTNKQGFAEILSGDVKPEDVISSIQVGYGTMDIITRGQTPQCPSELLMHSNLDKVLKILSTKYDLIVIDTPPLDSLSDATIIGKYAGAVFVVVRSARQAKNEILKAVRTLTVTGVRVRGLIFNDYNDK
ncbi:MAG: polysaccharide biosynthesis tyrosine autokinase [Cocleimonas sp.]